MTQQQIRTGTKDVTYDLISLSYHALQGAEVYAQFEQDAREAGATDCAELFAKAHETNKRLADEAKQHLQWAFEKDVAVR